MSQQCKIPLPQAILNGFCIVTVKVLNSYDNFMFGAVMSVEENCIGSLELVLGFEIERIKISKEKSVVYHPEYKGVRLDIYAKDEKNTHYDVEMQVESQKSLGKRARYYHGQMTLESLASGMEYEELPKAFVIFVCDFGPFGQKRYCYTFSNCCLEDGTLRLEDGTQTIFLSTKGENRGEVSEGLVEFLEFVGASLQESEKKFNNKLVTQMQRTVREIKTNREMGERYMLLEEWLRDEKRKAEKIGRLEEAKENIISLLEELGEIPDGLQKEIESIEELAILKTIFKIAVKTESLETFEVEMERIFALEQEEE